VQVTLIDAATGVAFAKVKMAAADLPKSFEAQTTLHIGEEDWSVVDAQPRRREEYTKRGALTLRLHKLEMIAPDKLRFSQLDFTERFDDDARLDADEWISTTPLNTKITNPERQGLPAPEAAADEVFRIASELSTIRESIPVPNDGVYCPICHIANIDLAKLRTPCPRCGRPLLKFGWT
jgi:hypothetical protein